MQARGLSGQHDCHPGRSGKTGQPGQPLFRRRDIFILLPVSAGDHKSRQLPPRQFFAKGRKPRRQRNAAFGFIECLEVGFEHDLTILELRG